MRCQLVVCAMRPGATACLRLCIALTALVQHGAKQNLVKYGVLVRPSSILLLAKIPNVVLALSIWIYLFAAYGIETLHGRVPGPVYSTVRPASLAACVPASAGPSSSPISSHVVPQLC